MTEALKPSIDIIRELFKAVDPKDPRPRALPFPQSDVERVLFRAFDFKPVSVNPLVSGSERGFTNLESELLQGITVRGIPCLSSGEIEYTVFPKPQPPRTGIE